MPEHSPSADGRPVHPDVRFERHDARARPVVITAVALLVIVAVGHGVVWWMMVAMQEHQQSRQPRLSPQAARERVLLPRDLNQIPAPREQQRDQEDREAFQRTEEARLHNSGWVDAKAGVVHLKIDDAIRLMADPKTAAKHGLRSATARGAK